MLASEAPAQQAFARSGLPICEQCGLEHIQLWCGVLWPVSPEIHGGKDATRVSDTDEAAEARQIVKGEHRFVIKLPRSTGLILTVVTTRMV